MDTHCNWCQGYGKYIITGLSLTEGHVVKCRFCGGKKQKKPLLSIFGVRVFISDPYNKVPTDSTNEGHSGAYGFVYILRFSQNVLKIGHTQRDPSTRAIEWDLPLLAYAPAEDSAEAERAIHTALARYRRGSYELFEVGYSEAVQVVRRLLGKVIEV